MLRIDNDSPDRLARSFSARCLTNVQVVSQRTPLAVQVVGLRVEFLKPLFLFYLLFPLFLFLYVVVTFVVLDEQFVMLAFFCQVIPFVWISELRVGGG